MTTRFIFIFCLFFHLFPILVSGQVLKKEVKFSDNKFIPFYNLKKAGNTEIFQGNKKKKKYFEGWYFKMVAEDGKSVISVIPGISLSDNGKDQHAFIQLIDGVTAETFYFTFPISEFSFSKSEFAIKIGDNYFSEHSLILNLKDSLHKITGKVEMANLTKYSKGKSKKKSIMGWYRFVPFMQCYHGVVSLTHDLKGSLKINESTLQFDNGKGYIEKDWGSSMPSSWIWLQSNYFSQNNSIMLSVADVPWLGKSFTGFLGFLYFDQKTYRFATYGRAKLDLQIIDENTFHVVIKDKKFTLILDAHKNTTGLLKAPVEGAMDRRIPEGIDAHLKMILLDKNNNCIYSDSTEITGLEMVGNFSLMEGLLK